jgi:hypothetical protein
VDPDNRLVASVLEAEWNAKLRELEEARAIEEQDKQDDQHQGSTQEREETGEVPEHFRQFWTDPKTTTRERKRAVRLVIEDVTVLKAERLWPIFASREGQCRPSMYRCLLRLLTRA